MAYSPTTLGRQQDTARWLKKVSHFHESSLNRIKIRH